MIRAPTSSRAPPICARCTTATAIPAVFAAYNAGPRRVDEHLSDGRPLPAETRAYLAALGHADVARERSPVVASTA